MKTGVKTSLYYQPGTTVTDYAQIRRHGYTCADYQLLMATDGALYAAEESIFEKMLLAEREQAQAAGVEFSQVHAPWPTDDTTEENRAATLRHMKKAVRGTALLGSKYLVVHPVLPYGWGKEDDPEFTEKLNAAFFSELCDYAQHYGVGICMENLPFRAYRLSRMEEMLRFMERYRIPNLYICMDTGHCNVFGDDCGEMIRLCGDKLKVFHIHDNNGLRDDHNLPYSGTIRWQSFKDAIREIGFNGCLSSEADVSRELPEDIQEYMKIGLSKIMRSLG